MAGDPPKGGGPPPPRVMLGGRRHSARPWTRCSREVWRVAHPCPWCAVLRGGIGKTRWGYASETGAYFLVARSGGCRVERWISPFAALHQMVRPDADPAGWAGFRARISMPRRGCRASLPRRAGSFPGRLAVFSLGLLSEVACDRPRLCLVDDAQLLDRPRAQALRFLGRRLDSESFSLLFGSP